jgi:hypothetical protein
MTIHAASTYFDEDGHPLGYVIGSDSRYKAEDSDTKEEVMGNTEKAIFGSDFIGVAGGSFIAESLDDFCLQLEKFGDIFEGIEVGNDYSNHDCLNLELYSFLIARERENHVDLLAVGKKQNPKGLDHKVRLLHRINKNEMITSQDRLITVGSYGDGYAKLEINRPLNLEIAKEVVTGLLVKSVVSISKFGEEYEPGQPNLYRVGFDGFGRCE